MADPRLHGLFDPQELQRLAAAAWHALRDQADERASMGQVRLWLLLASLVFGLPKPMQGRLHVEQSKRLLDFLGWLMLLRHRADERACMGRDLPGG